MSCYAESWFSSLGWWLWTTHHLDLNSSTSSSVAFSGRKMQVATDAVSIVVAGSNGSQVVPPLDVFAPVFQSREATLFTYDKGRHSCQSRSSRSNPSYKSLQADFWYYKKKKTINPFCCCVYVCGIYRSCWLNRSDFDWRSVVDRAFHDTKIKLNQQKPPHSIQMLFFIDYLKTARAPARP